MPTLHYYYVSPEEKAAASISVKPRPVGWRAWWSGSPYANPVSGMIDRVMDGFKNIQIYPGRTGTLLPIHISARNFRVQLPDGTAMTYLIDEVSDIVFDMAHDAGSFNGINRNAFTFLHGETLHEFDLKFDRPAIMDCIELFLNHRIFYKEYVGQSRTFRLSSNLMYKDIQELKDKFGISW